MSSGYSSLEEDSEEFFFTARTSFFRKPSGKVAETKVSSPKRVFSSQEKLVMGEKASTWHRSPFEELQNELFFV